MEGTLGEARTGEQGPAFGCKVRDKVTGLVGTIVARTDWWVGRSCFGIEPVELKDGCLQETEWIDRYRIEVFTE